MFTVTVSVVGMTGAGWIVVVAVFRFWSAVSAASESTSGNLWTHKAILDNKVISGVSANTYYDVTHPIACMVTCSQNSTCDGLFYSESEAKCVTCPYPCQQASLVTGSGFHYYTRQTTLQCPTQKGYYHYDDTGVCLRLHTDLQAWHDAQLFCQLDGGHLFDFKTEQEFDNLKDYLTNVIDAPSIPGSSLYWLGATDEVTEGVWLWTDGTLATDMLADKFSSSEPDGGDDQNGVAMKPWMELHDGRVSLKGFYVCEIDLSQN